MSGSSGPLDAPDTDEPSPVVVLMGVTGVGKSTIGRALSEHLGWSFVDADDYHSAANVAKMKRGEPLVDDDRRSWLDGLHQVIADHRTKGLPLVLACSALKRSYRETLTGGLPSVVFVLLQAPSSLIASRMASRRGHYMPESLLASQLDALEPPADAIDVDASRPVEETVRGIADQISLMGRAATGASKLRDASKALRRRRA